MTDEPRIGWTQPLCPPCFAAWKLGQGEIEPEEPVRVVDRDADPCLVCGEYTTIYARISPELAGRFKYAKREVD